MKRVDLITLVISNEPIPPELFGFPDELLADLSWLGVGWEQYKSIGWWPEVNVPVVIGEYERANGETYQVDTANKVVLVTQVVLPWSAAEIAADKASKIELLEGQIANIAQARLDAFARTKRYESILSATTYANDPDPEFAAQGQRALKLRSQYWRKLWDTLEAVKAGITPLPNSIDDIQLPALTWEEGV